MWSFLKKKQMTEMISEACHDVIVYVLQCFLCLNLVGILTIKILSVGL